MQTANNADLKPTSQMSEQEKRAELEELTQQLEGHDLTSLLLIARAYAKRRQ